jgi:hypothetical protein
VVPQRVLAGSLGCRSRRATLGPHSRVSGLASPRWRLASQRAYRRKGARSSMEGALVMQKPRPLTRRRWEQAWRPVTVGSASAGSSRRARQRASEATSQARRAVDNTAAGRYRSEGLSIAAPARTERRYRSRGSRSSWIRAAATSKLEDRRQARLHPAQPGIEGSVGCSCRGSVAEVGEKHLSRGTPGRPGRARDRLKRPASL